MINSSVAHEIKFKARKTIQFTFTGINLSVDALEVIESEKFSLYDLDWIVKLHANGIVDESKGNTRINLELKGSGSMDVYYSLTLKDQIGNNDIVNTGTSNFTHATKSWGWSKFTTFAKLIDPASGYLVDGKVIIHLDATVLKNPISVMPTNDTATQWWDSIPSLLNDADTADFKIKVGRSHIMTHKLLLGLKSEVWKTMFASSMKESTSNELIITDFPLKIVKSMLRCLYEPQSADTELSSNASQLLAIANKYQITDLVTLAEQYITNTITTESAVDWLKFADIHSSETIKEAAMKVRVFL